MEIVSAFCLNFFNQLNSKLTTVWFGDTSSIILEILLETGKLTETAEASRAGCDSVVADIICRKFKFSYVDRDIEFNHYPNHGFRSFDISVVGDITLEQDKFGIFRVLLNIKVYGDGIIEIKNLFVKVVSVKRLLKEGKTESNYFEKVELQ